MTGWEHTSVSIVLVLFEEVLGLIPSMALIPSTQEGDQKFMVILNYIGNRRPA